MQRFNIDGEQLVLPDYTGNSCFSCIPDTVLGLLTGDFPGGSLNGIPQRQFKKVITFFIDSFGMCFWNRFREESELVQTFERSGLVLPITAMFPSTTAAHVTTMYTGLPVGESAIYEWRMTLPGLGMSTVLPFTLTLPDHSEVPLASLGVSPEQIYPRASFAETLHKAGKTAVYIADNQICSSATNRYLGRAPGRVIGFSNFLQLQNNLKDWTKEPDCHYSVYLDQIDGWCHRHGPDSALFKAETRDFLKILWKLMQSVITPDTAVLLIADHGQVAADLKTTLWLDKRFPEISKLFEIDPVTKRPITPAGSPRDLFMHIASDSIEEWEELYRTELSENSLMFKMEELDQLGAFGPVQSDLFKQRRGNYVLLPRGNNTIAWSYMRPGKNYLGLHGGMSADEMEIPFALITA